MDKAPKPAPTAQRVENKPEPLSASRSTASGASVEATHHRPVVTLIVVSALLTSVIFLFMITSWHRVGPPRSAPPILASVSVTPAIYVREGDQAFADRRYAEAHLDYQRAYAIVEHRLAFEREYEHENTDLEYE